MSTEKYTISGSQLVEKIKQLIHEGNIRRVRVLHEGKTVLEIPLSVGAPAAAITIMTAPLLAALGAFAALVTECTVEVEKIDRKK
jgi:hypothetical protein